MDFSTTTDPLMAMFEEDLYKNKAPTHITDLIIITIKSLLPSDDYSRVFIDYKRYEEELKLWKYYKHGENRALMNILDSLQSNVYWKEKDDTVYSRIIPIILTNKDYSAIREEVIKNILFTTGNIETLIEGILLSRLLYLNISNASDVIDKIKGEVINLSQFDFLNEYGKYYRIPLEQYEGNFQVDFERDRIFALNTLNFSYSNRFKTLEDCIDVIFNNEEPNTLVGKCLKPNNENRDYKVNSYYYSLSNYIYQLRNGKIDKDALKINKYYLPDIFKFSKGDEFYHSLLKKVKVIEKKKVNNEIIVHLKTKSGEYILKKQLNLP